MSNLRNALCRDTIFSGHVGKPHTSRMSTLRKGHVALSNLGGQEPFPCQIPYSKRRSMLSNFQSFTHAIMLITARATSKVMSKYIIGLYIGLESGNIGPI